MSALLHHIQSQQTPALHLEHILEAAETLTLEGLAPSAVASLITTARSIACELNGALDSAALPKGDAA